MLTQAGGLALILAVVCMRWLRLNAVRWFSGRAGVALLTLAIYALLSVAVIPPLAALGGRYPLPCGLNAQVRYSALTPLTCGLNRHYARREVHIMLAALSGDMDQRFPGTVIGYLDAGFPFADWFPLLPHLSHGDGRRIDLAFFFQDGRGEYQPLRAPSLLGYWGFVEPSANAHQPCDGRRDLLTLRWDMGVLQPFTSPMQLDTQRTAFMLHWLTREGREYGVRRVLLEPHLKQRFVPEAAIVRFQGCRAARHDDHVHVDIEEAS